MGTPPLRSHAKKVIEGLSEGKIRVAVDFLDHLQAREMNEATLEILSSRELMHQITAAEDSQRNGRMDDFVPWDKVKRHV